LPFFRPWAPHPAFISRDFARRAFFPRPRAPVPPPPEDAKFVFLGIGVSVYNKEMLSKNRLPLVNGFSQLVVSKDYERDEQEDTSPRDREEEASSGGAGGRRHGHRHRQPPPPPHPVEAPTGVVGVAAGRGQQQQQRPQQGSAVPATLSQRSGVSTGGSRDEGEGGGPTNRDQLEALTNYAVGRVQKQVDITKQVVEELKKLTPGKLREAAVVQANKVQEMPTLLMDTSKRMVASGMKFVRNHMDEQDRKK